MSSFLQIRSMMTISRAARPRTSWVRSATRSQLGRSRSCPASGHNLDGGPEIRGSVSDNLWNSKREILSCVRCARPSARFGSPTEEERGIHGAHLTKLPNPPGRAGRNRRASPTQTREKRRNGAAWAPILMFARGRAGAKGDVWSGILVCGHPVTGHPRATHLVHTLVHHGPHARKSSIRSMIRQFVLERPTQYDENSDGWRVRV